MGFCAEKAVRLANEAEARRRAARESVDARVMPDDWTVADLVDALKDDKADLFDALDAAETEIRHLRLALRAATSN
jgi:hypothetical protein